MMQRRKALGVSQLPLPAPPAPASSPEEKLDYLIKQLQRLIEIAEALLGKNARVIPTVFSIPLDPLELTMTSMQEMGPSGEGSFPSSFPTTALTWTVLAGATVDHVIGIPEGTLELSTSCVLASDFYDPNIAVTVSVDDDKVVTPLPLALTRPTPITFGGNYIKRLQIVVHVFNNTATDAVLTLELHPRIVEKSVFDAFQRPLIDYVSSCIRLLAEAEGGK